MNVKGDDLTMLCSQQTAKCIHRISQKQSNQQFTKRNDQKQITDYRHKKHPEM